jgi:predicted nucleotidyltransferase
LEELHLDQATFPPKMLTELTRASLILSGYGAQQVILYGSLARGTYRVDSDIDLCVKGLPTRNFFPAVADCLMQAEHAISIIDLENLTGYFKTRLLNEGKILMSLDILRQEVTFGLENLEKIHHQITTFSQLDIAPEIKVSALTYECLGYYNALEHLIIRILKYLKLGLPQGQFSHRDTLRSFETWLLAHSKPETQLSKQQLLKQIEALMAFRHIATKIYGFLIDERKLQTVIQGVTENHSALNALFVEIVDEILTTTAS